MRVFVVLGGPPDDEVVEVRPELEPRPTCCSIPVCRMCGGHDPLSGHKLVCHCGLGW